jgi:hypothetical protein
LCVSAQLAVAGALRNQRGHSHRRRRVATRRLEHDGLRFDANRAQLFGHEKPMRLVADDDRGLDMVAKLAKAQKRVLQKSSVRDERQ